MHTLRFKQIEGCGVVQTLEEDPKVISFTRMAKNNKGRRTVRETGREADRQQTFTDSDNRQTDRLMDWLTDRQAERQTDRQTGRDRQLKTNRLTD